MLRFMPMAFAAIILITCTCTKKISFHDGFESGKLAAFWDKSKFLPRSVALQSAIVRKGKGAVKITLCQGDQIESERGTELERAELLENRNNFSFEDRSYTYTFSLFLPQDFPILPTRLVIAQWKQYCSNGDTCGDNSPVIAMRYSNGELTINIKVGMEKVVLFRTSEEIRNQWLDFAFKIRFSRSAGKISTWLNGKEIITYSGPIGYTEKEGYPSKSYYYFKTGLYRDSVSEPMTIYIDEYSKQESSENSF
jgi:hypothetical protein